MNTAAMPTRPAAMPARRAIALRTQMNAALEQAIEAAVAARPGARAAVQCCLETAMACVAALANGGGLTRADELAVNETRVALMANGLV